MNLTLEQSADLAGYEQWYFDNGWVGDEGREQAWIDLCAKYPELRDIEKISS